MTQEEKITAYWKRRCQLAEKYIEESPCDPDSTTDQLIAYMSWRDYISKSRDFIEKLGD